MADPEKFPRPSIANFAGGMPIAELGSRQQRMPDGSMGHPAYVGADLGRPIETTVNSRVIQGLASVWGVELRASGSILHINPAVPQEKLFIIGRVINYRSTIGLTDNGISPDSRFA